MTVVSMIDVLNFYHACDIVEIRTLEQLPIVLKEAQIQLHLINGDDEALNYIFLHRPFHALQILFHLVQCAHVLQIALILLFFGIVCETWPIFL